ncbi:MAG TPA: OmpA family protein [Cytophaga sp.]|jgi:peptidoglycan-associated lipoprotein|nr:OmpA family protein [Cytophaga sp.]
MRTVLLFFILLSVCTAHAQTSTFRLTDSTFTKNATYSCKTFDFYNACINQFDRARIDSIKKILRLNKSIKIQITCHTDQRGNAAYNKALSEKYAVRLKQMLVDSTIAKNRITTIGYGENKPLVDIKTIESYKTNKEKELAYEQNRRIEITITDL